MAGMTCRFHVQLHVQGDLILKLMWLVYRSKSYKYLNSVEAMKYLKPGLI